MRPSKYATQGLQPSKEASSGFVIISRFKSRSYGNWHPEWFHVVASCRIALVRHQHPYLAY